MQLCATLCHNKAGGCGADFIYIKLSRSKKKHKKNYHTVSTYLHKENSTTCPLFSTWGSWGFKQAMILFPSSCCQDKAKLREIAVSVVKVGHSLWWALQWSKKLYRTASSAGCKQHPGVELHGRPSQTSSHVPSPSPPNGPAERKEEKKVWITTGLYLNVRRAWARAAFLTCSGGTAVWHPCKLYSR